MPHKAASKLVVSRLNPIISASSGRSDRQQSASVAVKARAADGTLVQHQYQGAVSRVVTGRAAQ